MRNCVKSIHANPIIKKHITPASSTYTVHTKKVYIASNLQCPIGKKYKDFDLHNRECWDSIASEMVSDMNRLNSALRPIYMKLRGKTPHEYRIILRHWGVKVDPIEWEDVRYDD